MPVQRLNHAVLYVRDVEESVHFYHKALGFTTVTLMPGQAAFLRAAGSHNDHDLGLFQIGSGAEPSAAGRSEVGLYHLAWEVDTLGALAEIAETLGRMGALVGSTDHSTTKALYARDPDGLEFEVCWLVPAELLSQEVLAGRMELRPLDLGAEVARYGKERRGGVGVSTPA